MSRTGWTTSFRSIVTMSISTRVWEMRHWKSIILTLTHWCQKAWTQTTSIESTTLCSFTASDLTTFSSKSVKETKNWSKTFGRSIHCCWSIVLLAVMKLWLAKLKEISLGRFRNSKWKYKNDRKWLRGMKNLMRKKILICSRNSKDLKIKISILPINAKS